MSHQFVLSIILVEKMSLVLAWWISHFVRESLISYVIIKMKSSLWKCRPCAYTSLATSTKRENKNVFWVCAFSYSVQTNAGVIDERTKCWHQGQEVGPRLGKTEVCSVSVTWKPKSPPCTFPQHRGLFQSVCMSNLSFFLPPSLPLSVPLTHISVRPVYSVIFWTRPSLTPDRWG